MAVVENVLLLMLMLVLIAAILVVGYALVPRVVGLYDGERVINERVERPVMNSPHGAGAHIWLTR